MAKTSNVVKFQDFRSRLVSRNRKCALPALVSLILRQLKKDATLKQVSGHRVEENNIGPFSLMASWNRHGRYLRVDHGANLVFSSYLQPPSGYHVMTWRRHPSWEAKLYDEIRKRSADQ